MSKPSEAAMRIFLRLQSIIEDDCHSLYNDYTQLSEEEMELLCTAIVDKELAPAIDALRWYGKNAATTTTTGSRARNALEDLGIPLEENA